jgi:cytochrome P450
MVSFQFRPERFLDPETHKFVSDERVIPFSTGRRKCVGKSLAERQYFLFVVGMLQKFTFDTSKEYPLPSFSPDDQVSQA